MLLIKLFFLCLLSFLSASTLEDIIFKNYNHNHFKTFHNYSMQVSGEDMPMLMHKTGKKISKLYFEQYQLNDKKEKHIFIYHSGIYKNIKVLIEIEEQNTQVNVWLPQFRKTRRIISFRKSDPWNGTNFTYGDILLIHPKDEIHEILGYKRIQTNTQKLENFKVKNYWNIKEKETIKIKSTPKNANLNYDHRISYIDKEYYFDYIVEYYKNSVLIKRLEKVWHDKKDGVSILGYWYAKNFLLNTESLIYIPKSSTVFNSNLNKKNFSKNMLHKTIHAKKK